MKDLKLTIQINKPVHEVFDFALNPKNTPKWIDALALEETNEWPPKPGTRYRNRTPDGPWREFEVTALEPNKLFVLSRKDGYHVRYTCTALGPNATELEYYEWVDAGELEDVLTMETLQKLKQVIEA